MSENIAPTISPASLATAGYDDGEDTMKNPGTYDVINLIGGVLNRDAQVAILAHKGVGRDDGKVVFTVLLPEKELETEVEKRLFTAIKRNIYHGRTPKIARFRQVSDITAF